MTEQPPHHCCPTPVPQCSEGRSLQQVEGHMGNPWWGIPKNDNGIGITLLFHLNFIGISAMHVNYITVLDVAAATASA